METYTKQHWNSTGYTYMCCVYICCAVPKILWFGTSIVFIKRIPKNLYNKRNIIYSLAHLFSRIEQPLCLSWPKSWPPPQLNDSMPVLFPTQTRNISLGLHFVRQFWAKKVFYRTFNIKRSVTYCANTLNAETLPFQWIFLLAFKKEPTNDT